MFAYQKNKNSSQALLRFIEQMLDTISSRKYSVAVMADLEGGFDPVWSKGAIYKLLKAGIYNNLLSVFSGFLKDRYSGNLIRGTPRLSPSILLMYIAALTMGDKPFQERHAVTCMYACTCRKAFRSVLNHTCKSNFWLHIFTTNCLSLIKICAYYHGIIKQVAVVDLNWSYVHNYFDCESYCWFYKRSKSPHYNRGT